MRYRKLLTSGILTGAICLLTVLAFTTEKADAWGYWGFSNLCVNSTLRGPAGDTVTFKLQNVTVYTQCFNVNGGNLGQPGTGNLGFEELVLTTESVDTGKLKGIIGVDGCIDLSRFDDHDRHTASPDDHTCHPLDNVNKEEQEFSAWIANFTATWVWKDDKGRVINEGTDVCHTWLGDWDDDGLPTEAGFDCDSTSAKKIKWVLEDNF